MGSPAARPPATSPQVPTAPRVPTPSAQLPAQGGIRPAPSVRKMGEMIPPAHLLGRVAYKAK